MRSKLNFLIDVSLKKKIKSKWFLIANIIIAIILVAIINIDSIVTLFGGDFDAKTKMYVVDKTKAFYDSFKKNLNDYEKNLYGDNSGNYDIILANDSVDNIKQLIQREEPNSLLIYVYYDESNHMNSKLISLSTIDSYDYQLISSAITTTANINILNTIDLTLEQYNKIINGIKIEREILDSSITNEDEAEQMIMTTVFPIVILPFFMLTIFLVQFIGSEVNDEKSTKSMEIIISNVSPKIHFAAKIISNNLFIIFQVILIIIYAILGIQIRGFVGGDSIVNGIGNEITSALSSLSTGVFGNNTITFIILTILLMLLTFIAYSLVAGILASMTTNSDDYQQVQVPIMVVLLLSYYLAVMAGIFKGSLFIKVLSFVPFISAILSPSLLVLGQVGILEIILSTLIMVFTIYVLIKYGLRIYKVGILNYSSTDMWKKMFKSLRNKE